MNNITYEIILGFLIDVLTISLSTSCVTCFLAEFIVPHILGAGGAKGCNVSDSCTIVDHVSARTFQKQG